MSRTSLTKGLCNDSYPYVGMNKATRVMCRTSEQEYRNISQTLQVAFDIYLKHLGYSSNLSNTLHFVGAISAVVKFMISQHSRDSLMNPWSSPIALRIGKSQNVIKKKKHKNYLTYSLWLHFSFWTFQATKNWLLTDLLHELCFPVLLTESTEQNSLRIASICSNSYWAIRYLFIWSH